MEFQAAGFSVTAFARADFTLLSHSSHHCFPTFLNKERNAAEKDSGFSFPIFLKEPSSTDSPLEVAAFEGRKKKDSAFQA